MKRRACLAAMVASALVVGSAATASEAPAAPGPRFGDNYRLTSNTTARGRDVPGLAVDPADQNHIVEADVNPINLECDYHVSFDGGRTWAGDHLRAASVGKTPDFPVPACDQNFDAGGYAHFNTGIVFGSGQNVYITFSAHRGPFERLDTAPPTEGGVGDEVLVARSTDGGKTFAPAVVAISLGETPQPVATRPQIAVERGLGTGGQDRLYVNAWELRVTSAGGDRRVRVARSDDGGATWGPAVIASKRNVRLAPEAAAVDTPDEIVRELSQPVVGPDGVVYTAYRNVDKVTGTTCPANPASSPPNQQTNCIVVAKSDNRGQTWTQLPVSGPLSGTTGQPRMAIDPSTPVVGTLYVVYHKPGAGTDPDDIFLQSSTDRGQTWSSPTRVNDEPVGSSAQTFAQVSVGPGGRVDVIWFDRRHPYPAGATPRLGDIYYARSTDHGATFSPNRRVTDRTFNRDVGIDSFLGSYSFYGPVSLPLADGGALAAFMDSREGNLDNGVQDIYLARLDANGAIAKSRLATASLGGLSVVLSRLAYPGGAEAAGPTTPVTKLVVANEGDVPAVLAGSVLARANWGSLLLSPVGGLPGVVKADAARMQPEGGFVVGETSVLSAGVESDLRQSTRNGQGVSRVAPDASVAAADRPAEVARQVGELMKPLPGAKEAVIANPATPEAASASGLAASLKLPILFVDGRATLPAPTAQAMSSLGVTKVLIVGGPGAVNASVEASLVASLGAGNVKRLGGADQYETSEAVLTEARARGLPTNVVYVADGARPIDGALLGAAVGRLGGLMLLRPSADTGAATESRLAALGAEAAVDRMVAAVGTGGSDPELPASPGADTPTGLTASGTTTTGGAGADTLAPGVTDYGLTNNPFRVARGSTPTFGSAAATRRKPRRHKQGTTFRYTLSEAATVRIVIARGRGGRIKNKRCVAPTRRLRKARRCVALTVQGTLTRTSKTGRNSVAFSGRIGSRALRPGNYQATLTATDTANNTSKPKTITFTITKR